MRGRSLMFMGQGISNLGATIGDLMIKSKESKFKKAEAESATKKNLAEADYKAMQGLNLKADVDAKRIALAQAEEEDRVLAGLFEAVSMLPKSKRIQNEFATLIDKGLQASQEPKTQYQTPAGTWEGEDTEAPQTPEEKPLSRNEQHERILKEYPQAIGIKNPGVQQYLSYLREPEEAPGETPEQKMQREKETITWRAEEAKRTRPPGDNIPKTPAGIKIRALGEGQENKLTMIATTANSIQNIEKAMEPINNLKYGPIKGGLLSKNPYDKELRIMENLVNQIVPSMARGIFNEVGVLTDQDIKYYKSLLPQIKQDPTIAKQILEQIKDKINTGYNLTLATYENSGRDVSGFRFKDVWEYTDKFSRGGGKTDKEAVQPGTEEEDELDTLLFRK